MSTNRRNNNVNNASANVNNDAMSAEQQAWATALGTAGGDDSVHSGLPQGFKGVLTIKGEEVEPTSVPVDGTSNSWIPVKVRTSTNVEYEVNAKKILRLPGNWGTNSLSERGVMLQDKGAVITLSDYVWTDPDEQFSYIRKKMVGSIKLN